MNDMKIFNKLLLYISLPVMIVLAVISFFSYQQAKSALNEQVMKSASFLTYGQASEIEKIVRQRQAVVETMAAQLERGLPGDEELRMMLEHMTKKTNGASDIYVGFADKRYIDGTGWRPPAGYDPTVRSWYQKAAEAQTAAYSDVYIDGITKKPIVSIAKAIRINGQLIGVIGLDLDLKEITESVQKVKVGKSGYAFLLSRDGYYISHPSLKVMEDNIYKMQEGSFAEMGKAILSGKATFQEVMFNGVERLVASAPIGSTGWAIGISVPKSEIYQSVTTLGNVSSGISVTAAILLFFIIVGVARSIVQPLKEVTGNLEMMAGGDFTQEIKAELLTRKDEFGVMAAAYMSMSRQVRSSISKVMQSAEQLGASSQEVTSGASQSADAAQSVAQSINEIALGADQQSRAVNETVSAIHQIGVKVNEMEDKAQNLCSLAENTDSVSKNGHSALVRATAQMNQINVSSRMVETSVEQLSESSQKIQEIVSLITGIAGQTNLLALNAAIEAARAGEQGKGFAVVAEEVRKLAEQSEIAARQISGLIQGNVENIQAAVKAMAEGISNVEAGNKVMQEVDQAFCAITESVGKVTGESKLMSEAIGETVLLSRQIEVNSEKIDAVVKQSAMQTEVVSAATQEQSASAEEIAAASRMLFHLSEELRMSVNSFKV